MVGEFMVCVDRIIASACLDSGNGVGGGAPGVGAEGGVEEGSLESRRGGQSRKKSRKGGGGGGREVMECRICQEEEEEEGNLESPCACNGTLKFAHRKCIQRWCNKKGDITCEICNQVYAPNYTIPPDRASSDVMAIDIRSWGTRLDLHDPHYLAFASAEEELLRHEYEDYAAANSSGIACCRSVAVILMLLLLVRHILMVTRDSGTVQDASAFFNVSLLQFAGFLLPCYVVARSCYIIQNRRRGQV